MRRPSVFGRVFSQLKKFPLYKLFIRNCKWCLHIRTDNYMPGTEQSQTWDSPLSRKLVNHSASIRPRLCPPVCDPMDCTLLGLLSTGFPRQEYWSGLPFPPPGNHRGGITNQWGKEKLLNDQFEDDWLSIWKKKDPCVTS